MKATTKSKASPAGAKPRQSAEEKARAKAAALIKQAMSLLPGDPPAPEPPKRKRLVTEDQRRRAYSYIGAAFDICAALRDLGTKVEWFEDAPGNASTMVEQLARRAARLLAASAEALDEFGLGGNDELDDEYERRQRRMGELPEEEPEAAEAAQ